MKKKRELSVFEGMLVLYIIAIAVLLLFSLSNTMMGVYSIELLAGLYVTVIFAVLSLPLIWFQEKKNRKAPEEQDGEL